jgi:hypothetical protein
LNLARLWFNQFTPLKPKVLPVSLPVLLHFLTFPHVVNCVRISDDLTSGAKVRLGVTWGVQARDMAVYVVLTKRRSYDKLPERRQNMLTRDCI